VEDAISGVFGGGGGPTIGTAPNSQERGVYEVEFWGGGGAGARKTTTPDSPRTPPCDIARAKKISAEN